EDEGKNRKRNKKAKRPVKTAGRGGAKIQVPLQAGAFSSSASTQRRASPFVLAAKKGKGAAAASQKEKEKVNTRADEWENLHAANHTKSLHEKNFVPKMFKARPSPEEHAKTVFERKLEKGLLELEEKMSRAQTLLGRK
ncbi:unnamed protein product, partial [Amoebophrya sp. A120]